MPSGLGLGCGLALAGLALAAFAELPPGLPGHFSLPYYHVPVDARVVDVAAAGRVGADGGVSKVRLHFLLDGRPHDETFTGSDRIALPSGDRRVGELRPEDRLQVWIDPDRPGSVALWPARRLGQDSLQIVLGAALLLVGVAMAGGAVLRSRR